MNVLSYLDDNHVNYRLRTHRPAFTAQKIAAAEHVSGMNVAKPVVIQADGKFYMCVLPACCRVDLDMLRSQLGAGEIQLVPEEEMRKLFPDCEIGAEPPMGHLFGMTTLMDKTLSRDEFLVFQAGRHDEAVQINRRDYENLVRPKMLSFSYHLH